MENQRGFSVDGNWYKGNLHSHTTNSDGCLVPNEAVALYKSHGYHFICLSDHETYTDYREELNSENFIILPGLEASAILYDKENPQYGLKVHHIHGILGTSEMQKNAVKPLPFHKQILDIDRYYGIWDGAYAAQKLTDKLLRYGFITIYNHPIWSRVTAEEFIHTEGLLAIEIYNYNTVNESGTGYDTTYWDLMLRNGKQIHATASDDNHNEGLFEDSCGAYVMVKADSLSHDNIIEGLISGNYYSTSGPEIFNWGVESGYAFVECSPVYKINFIIGNHVNAGATFMCASKTETMNGVKYQLNGNEKYLRIECVDVYGNTAWTNSIFFN